VAVDLEVGPDLAVETDGDAAHHTTEGEALPEIGGGGVHRTTERGVTLARIDAVGQTTGPRPDTREANVPNLDHSLGDFFCPNNFFSSFWKFFPFLE